MLVRGIPASWVGDRIGVSEFGPHTTMGLVVDGRITVGLVFCDYKPDIQAVSFCLAVDDCRAITKGVLKAVFAYAFDELGVRRITNSCSVNNRKAIAINKRAGLVQEGVLRKGYPDGSDMILFGMLREECKYL